MTLIVADTGPINYLIRIGFVDVLHGLVDSVALTAEVLTELQAEGAPPVVRSWANHLPAWVRVEAPSSLIPGDVSLSKADRSAISLAKQHGALLLMDDRRARQIASGHGLITIGTLGILEAAAAKSLVALPIALERLQQTTIYLGASLIEETLARDANRRESNQGTDQTPEDSRDS